MAIPNYQEYMLPLLTLASDGQEHKMAEAVAKLSDEFGLTQEERVTPVSSSTEPVIASRASWARTYLKKAGLLTNPKRSYFRITDRGRALLAQKPSAIGLKDLEQYEEFNDFLQRSKRKATSENRSEESPNALSPNEALEYSYRELSEALSGDLLQKIMACSPAFFERFVVELLVKMGYGGSLEEASSVVGRSGDGGIDGIIKEDRLGLDAIYIQAKRWQGTVGRPEIQKFAGALQGQKANKGVFITTSEFTKEALDFVKNINTKIVLIDGTELTGLAVEHNLGVSIEQTYEIKRIDSDYFEEE